jgi:DNA polymerase III delta subunit
MIYIFYGDNDLLIEDRLLKFGTELVYLDSNDEDFLDRFKQHLNPRLLGENPSLVLKGADKLNSRVEDIVKQLVDNHITVIFISKAKPEQLLKKLKDHKITYEVIECTQKPFKQRQGQDFIKFVKSMIAEYKLKLPPGTSELFSSVFINQPRILKQELRKLSAFKQGEMINKEEMLALIHWPPEGRVWDLTDALLERNWSKFLLFLDREIKLFFLDREIKLNKDEKIPWLIGALKTTVLNLLLVKAASESGKLQSIKLHPYYKFKLTRYCHNFSYQELLSLLKILANLDRRYKKYQLDIQNFLSEFVFQLTEEGFKLTPMQKRTVKL